LDNYFKRIIMKLRVQQIRNILRK